MLGLRPRTAVTPAGLGRACRTASEPDLGRRDAWRWPDDLLLRLVAGGRLQILAAALEALGRHDLREPALEGQSLLGHLLPHLREPLALLAHLAKSFEVLAHLAEALRGQGLARRGSLPAAAFTDRSSLGARLSAREDLLRELLRASAALPHRHHDLRHAQGVDVHAERDQGPLAESALREDLRVHVGFAAVQRLHGGAKDEARTVGHHRGDDALESAECGWLVRIRLPDELPHRRGHLSTAIRGPLHTEPQDVALIHRG
mmetsp:Transcript_24757/g.74367  ORF Transcript_24757/g.74367 Transcript_24757/m.74367 type:complete len:260 (+) Transcript_24757:24-803(+)